MTACACMGPMYGEPFCYCLMIAKNLPLSNERVVAAKEATEAMEKIFNGRSIIKDETNAPRDDPDE